MDSRRRSANQWAYEVRTGALLDQEATVEEDAGRRLSPLSRAAAGAGDLSAVTRRVRNAVRSRSVSRGAEPSSISLRSNSGRRPG